MFPQRKTKLKWVIPFTSWASKLILEWVIRHQFNNIKSSVVSHMKRLCAVIRCSRIRKDNLSPWLHFLSLESWNSAALGPWWQWFLKRVVSSATLRKISHAISKLKVQQFKLKLPCVPDGFLHDNCSEGSTSSQLCRQQSSHFPPTLNFCVGYRLILLAFVIWGRLWFPYFYQQHISVYF